MANSVIPEIFPLDLTFLFYAYCCNSFVNVDIYHGGLLRAGSIDDEAAQRRSEEGGEAADAGQHSEGGGEVLEAEDVDQAGGGDGGPGGQEEAEHDADDGVGPEVVAERHQGGADGAYILYILHYSDFLD